ncbi:MAG: hypothetical protein C5B50_00055 [Verrucomicrobia bacterium]|nr:MAG: hypothetical protein C5B50_00055 [Verrucomicrobiota bacterium]
MSRAIDKVRSADFQSAVSQVSNLRRLNSLRAFQLTEEMRTLWFTILAAIVMCGCATNPKWKSQQFVFELPPATPAATVRTNVIALARVSVAPHFQDRSLTYRTTDDGYEHDPYAEFAVIPERAIAHAIRAWMRQSGAFGHVADPGSGLVPDVVAEISVNELYGDFRKGTQPVAIVGMHYLFYEVKDGGPGKVLLDKTAVRKTALKQKTPAALVAGWNSGLGEIMQEIATEYSEACSRPF